jgi:hypothetical protein
MGDVSVRALFDASSAFEKRSQVSDWTFFERGVSERIGITGPQFSIEVGPSHLNQKARKVPLCARIYSKP